MFLVHKINTFISTQGLNIYRVFVFCYHTLYLSINEKNWNFVVNIFLALSIQLQNIFDILKTLIMKHWKRREIHNGYNNLSYPLDYWIVKVKRYLNVIHTADKYLWLQLVSRSNFIIRYFVSAKSEFILKNMQISAKD